MVYSNGTTTIIFLKRNGKSNKTQREKHMIVDMNGVTGIANPLCPNKTIHQCLPDGEVDLK